MKYPVLKAAVLGVFVLGIMSAGVRAQSTDNDSCSNSILKGDYAFTVSGQVFLPGANNAPPVVVQRDSIAMTHFDGTGNLSQVDFVLSSPNAPAPPGVLPTDLVTRLHIN